MLALVLLLLAGTLGALAAPPTPLLPGDLQAINAIAAQFPSWGRGQGADPCAWTGLVVCANSRVTNITGQGWEGPLPAELFNLTALTYLRVIGDGSDNNNINGSIPAEIGNLRALTYMDLNSNYGLGDGTIPPELGKLTALTYLNMSGTGLSGAIPPELGKLTVLTFLDLSINRLNGTIPPELWNLTALTFLELSGNTLFGTIPRELGNLTALTFLGLSSNNLSGTIFPVLWNLTMLTRLYLSEMSLFGAIPPELGNLAGLTDLDLRSNHLSGTISPELGKLTALTRLDLSSNNLSGTIPPELGKLTALTSLSLASNSLSSAIPPELGKLTTLTSLDLSSNNLSGTIPPELGNLVALDSLNLDSNGLSGAIPPELGKLTALYSLMLGHNNLIGPIPKELGKLTNLSDLDLSYNNLSGLIPTDIWKLPSLFSADLSGNFLNGTGNKQGWSLGLNCFNMSREKVYTAGQRDPALCSAYYPDLNCTCPPPKVAGAQDSCSCVLPLLFLANFAFDPNSVSPLSQFSKSLLDTRRAIGSFFASRVVGLTEDLIAPVNVSSGAANVVSLYFYILPPPGAPRFTAYLEANTLNETKLLSNSKRIEVPGFNPGPVYVTNVPLPLPPPPSLPPLLPPSPPPTSSTPIVSSATPPPTVLAPKSRGASTAIIATTSVAAFVAVGAALLAFALWLRRRRPRPNCITIEDTQVKQWKLAHVRVATQNFDPTYEIGKGGFATVYRGDFRGGVMAVKRLVKASTQLQEELIKEVQTVGSIHNRNLLALRGYCMEDDEFILIYDFMANGSLKARLFDPAFASAPLDWQQCVDIIVGIARGIAYLHEGCKETIIHRDIKPANILLDDNMSPQVADFGLVRSTSLAETHVSTKVAGTLGYMAPEYAMSGQLTTKSDVYSFGILLMVIISHMPASTPSPDGGWVSILGRARALAADGSLQTLVAPNLSVSSNGAEAERLLYIALLCTQEEWELRPTMGQVVRMLTSDVPEPKLSFLERLSIVAYPMEGMDNSRSLLSNPKSVTN